MGDKKEITQIQVLASHCVQCGACSAECPTYQYQHNENESPRGRIALSLALANKQLPASTSLQSHIESCLGCRACERACPAEVKVLDILDNSKALLPLTTLPLWLKVLMFSRLSHRLLHALIYIAQTLRLPTKVATKVKHPFVWRRHYKTTATSRGRVQLFLGCVSDTLAQHRLRGCVRLINHCGYDVEIPTKQVCCGALAKHNGQLTMAATLQTLNNKAFNTELPLIVSDSGCGAEIENSIDIMDWLLVHGHTLKFKSTNKKVLCHLPCSMVARNNMQALLAQFPNLEVITYQQQNCCGASGKQVLSPSPTAIHLGQTLLQYASEKQVEYIISANIGCIYHLLQLQNKAQKWPKICHIIDYMNDNLILC